MYPDEAPFRGGHPEIEVQALRDQAFGWEPNLQQHDGSALLISPSPVPLQDFLHTTASLDLPGAGRQKTTLHLPVPG